MLVALVLFLLSLLGLVGVFNALRGPATDRRVGLRPPFLPVLLTAEAVPLRVLIHAVAVLMLIRAGALNHLSGTVGLAMTLLTWAGYVVIQWRAAGTRKVMAAALDEVEIDPAGFSHVDWKRVLAAYPYKVPVSVERIEDLEYAPGLFLDLYRKRGAVEPCPVLVYLHGGSWRGGNRRQQGRPLLHRLAQRGWIGVSASYPLVPEATFPDQLIALKRAMAWLRDEGRGYGVDPSFIAVSGGSAGGHLAALVALTAGRPEYQPGFADEDTSIQAAVPVYGIYDFLNRNQTRDEWPIIPRWVMKADKGQDEGRFREASPLDQIHPEAPPFLVIHGAGDSVVPVAEAHYFVDALRRTSNHVVAYAEIPGANHAFDVLDSLRTHYVISGIQRFLEAVRANQTVP